MRTVLPGQPESRPQAVSLGFWDGRNIIVYIAGNSFTILENPQTIIQTIYDDDEQPLEAIDFDEASGKIATCTGATVRVYRPFGRRENALRWALQLAIDIPDKSAALPCILSWGASEELLLATSSLGVYFTALEAVCVWKRLLPSTSRLAAFSYDSSVIASAGHADCLVKVWHRLNYGSDDIRFGLSYLRHPDIVTGLRWRRPYHPSQTLDSVLYTLCRDGTVRIWVAGDTVCNHRLALWGEINMVARLSDPTYASSLPELPWVAILDGREFAAAIEWAVDHGPGEDTTWGRDAQRLVAIAHQSPELCLAFNGRGIMVAVAVENVGEISSGANQAISTLSRVSNGAFSFVGEDDAVTKYPRGQSLVYCDRSTGLIHVIVHAFDGKLLAVKAPVRDLFPLPTTEALATSIHGCTLSGHSAPIRKMVRNFSGQAVLSRTSEGQSILWKHTQSNHGHPPQLERQSTIPEVEPIHRISVLRKGRFVVLLHRKWIALWDCRFNDARLLAREGFEVEGKTLCLLILPRPNVEEYLVAHIATVTSSQAGIVWEVRLPHYDRRGVEVVESAQSKASIREFCRFSLNGVDDLAYVLPVDPAGASPVAAGFLDAFARDVAVSYTRSGRVDFWTARLDPHAGSIGWLSTSHTETAVQNPSLVSGSTLKKVALANSDRSQLTIWDIGGGRLEYHQDFSSSERIQDLDWTSTPDSQSILAVGFQCRVRLLSQMRYDYLNKGAAWAAVREISIRDLTPHPIGDSTWLGSGNLVIGAGNQLFVFDRYFIITRSLASALKLPYRRNGEADLFEAVQKLNGPLPVFHPQFLSQCILAGKSALVRRILVTLDQTLKFHSPGDSIDGYLGVPAEEFYLQKSTLEVGSVVAGYMVKSGSTAAEERDFSQDRASSINERLTNTALPQLSGHEQIQLADIVECVGLVEHHRRSLDENGARFVLLFRQHALRKGRAHEIHMSWREINWAFHSSSQDILSDFVCRQYHGNLRWDNARESGMFAWLGDQALLRSQFEQVARSEYAKGDQKNPVDCSLFYLALRKKTVLQGLWRMATGNREQAATLRLLSNNFDDPKWKTVALKNAYALLGKRRFQYAAAFFLLANHLQGAIDVCLDQLKDLQLAIAISRVYEGDGGPALRKLLETEVLGLAAREGNRWLACWAFWMLHRRDMAVQTLIAPVYTVVETPCPTAMDSRSFLTDDPALVVLYSYLRQMTLQTLRGASAIPPRVEWDFVLHSAKLYGRMGCDLLGLDLVRNWEFLPAASSLPTTHVRAKGDFGPLVLSRRRSSLVVADLPTTGLGEPASGTHDSPFGLAQTPASFQEPDAGSLLDSFGF